MNKRRQNKGFSLLEVLIASAVMATVIGSVASFQTQAFRQTTRNLDRSFASEKAMQMYDELRSFVQSNRETLISSLDNFSDGNGYNWLLTTESNATEPAGALSENKHLGVAWKYARQVQIEPVENDDYSRRVTVKVFYQDLKSGQTPKPVGAPLAAISGVLKTNVDQYPPTQVYDVFMVAAENAPSWWVDVAALRPTFERLLDDLEYRNPGLRFRRHYVSRLGFGRDPYYLPYLNSSNKAHQQRLPWTYYYPGQVTRNNEGIAIEESYVEDFIQGRRRNDDPTALKHAERSRNQGPYRDYAMADQFNHVMRWPMHAAMTKRLKSLRNPNLNVDLVSFLEDLNSSPEVYRNAIIINLHGELIPFPPVRNTSDPARLPLDESLSGERHVSGTSIDTASMSSSDREAFEQRYRNLRVVTHPERLRYDNDSEWKLRVYAYQSLPYSASALPQVPGATDLNHGAHLNFVSQSQVDKISLFIPTDGAGRHPLNPAQAGFVNHPNANLDSTAVAQALAPEKILGSQRRPYVRKTKLPSSFFAGQLLLPQTQSRLVYRKTTDSDRLGASRTIEIGRNPQALPAALNSTFYLGGGGLSMPFDPTTSGTNLRLSFSRNDFNFAGLTDTERLRTLRDLIDQVVIIDPDIQAGSGTGTAHQGYQLYARVKSVNISGTRVDLTLYEPGEEAQLSSNWSSKLATTPASRVSYCGTSLMLGSNPVGGSPCYASGQFQAGTRVVLAKDYTVATQAQIYGQNTPGIWVTLFDTASRQPWKNNTQNEVWNEAGNAGWNGIYGGVYHNDANADAHQNGETRRLMREEYVPAPVNTEGSSSLDDDFARDLTFASASAQTTAKNTARWVLRLDTSSASFNAFDSRMISFETRIGDQLEDGMYADGDIYAPDNPATGSNENQTQLRPNVYNVSHGYLWTGASLDSAKVPHVERRQYLGDPRDMPYADLKAEHNYNRHFFTQECDRNGFSGACSNSDHAGYNGFERHVGNDWSDRAVNSDLNWFFQLYTHGIMRSNAVYNSVSGFSNYYYALGGEMGTDGTNARFQTRRQPWSETNTGSNNAQNTDNNFGNEITGNSRWIMSTQNSSGNNAGNSAAGNARQKWMSNPFRGELFPDEDYLFWKLNGNLPNHSYVNSDSLDSAVTTQRRYYRAAYTDGPLDLRRTHKRLAGQGAPSFMNGNTDPTGGNIDRGFQHDSTSQQWGELTRNPGDAGRFLADAFNLAMPDLAEADRPYKLNGNSGDGGYNTPEIRSLRNRLAYVNTGTGLSSSTASNQNTYYRHSSASDRTVSSVVKMTRDGDSDMSGYVLVNGFARSQAAGIQTIARFSQAGTLQAYMDSGDLNVPGNARGRSVQIPRVEITEPRSSVQSTASIAVHFDASWRRWDGQKYSPAYPEQWYDNTALVFNAKYFDAQATHPITGARGVWRYVNSNQMATEFMSDNDFSYYNPAEELFGSSPENTGGPVLSKSFQWNNSSLPNGNYKLRVEAYRNDFLKTGYTYHDLYITIKR